MALPAVALGHLRIPLNGHSGTRSLPRLTGGTLLAYPGAVSLSAELHGETRMTIRVYLIDDHALVRTGLKLSLRRVI